MSLGDLYAKEDRDFEKRVHSLAIEANHILKKFPYDFNDEMLRDVVYTILRKNNIDSDTELSGQKKHKILNERTLLDGILSNYIDDLKGHLFRQGNWLNSNDYQSSPEIIILRNKFIGNLKDIVDQADFTVNGGASLRQNLEISRQISDTINNTDLDALKDITTLGILEVCSSLLKLCVMIVAYPGYYDPIVSNKCRNGNFFNSIWSGKTLNDTHLEHLEAKVRRIEVAYNTVCTCLSIPEEPLGGDYANYRR